MFDFLLHLFDSSGFPPRWRCGIWTLEHGWLHVLSDLGVWSAYMAIPLVLVYFVVRKKDVPFRRIFQLFTAFILACGTTHLMEAIIFWWPAYRLAGLLKLATAIVSWTTVVALVRVLPRMLTMRTPEELETEVAARKAAEAELVKANADLEARVRERTNELTRANADLHAERERFRTTLESIGDAVIATDTVGRVTFLNAVAEKQTGWLSDAALGQPLQTVFQIVHETERTPVENPAIRALQDGVVVGMAKHTVLLSRDGNEHPIDDSAAPIRDNAGGIVGAVLVFRDVTHQRRAEVIQAEQALLTTLRADIASALAATQSKPQALQACCEALVRHLGVAFARIWTLQEAADTLELKASAGQYTHLDGPHSRIPLGHLKIGQIALSGVPFLTNSAIDDPNISDQEWVSQEGMVAFAGHPLVVEGRVVGVMALFARSEISANVLTDLARSADNIAQYIDRRRAEDKIRESEERYRLLFEASPLPMWVYDRNTLKFLEVNSAAVAKYGYTRDEFLARTVIDIRPVDEVPALLEVMATDEGPSNASVWSHQLRDGRVIRVRVVTHNLTFRGQPSRLVQAQDVTWQIQAEETLRASEAKFRTLYESSILGVAFWDTSGGLSEVNDALLEMVGYSREEFNAGQVNWRDITPKEHWPLDDFAISEMRAGAATYTPFEKEYIRKDGRRVPVLLSGAFLPNQPDHGVTFIVDLTARKRAEADLRASEERFRQAFDYSAIGMALVAPDGQFMKVNNAILSILGYPEAELLQRNSNEVTHPDDREADKLWVTPMLEGRLANHSLEKRYLRRDGTTVWVQLTISLVRDSSGRTGYFVAQFQDVTDRRAAQSALLESEERYRYLIGALAEGVVFQASDSTIQTFNANAARILGLTPEQLLGRTSLDHRWRTIHEDSSPFHGEDHPSMLALRTGKPCEGVVMGVYKPDDTLSWISINAEPLIRPGELTPYGVVCSFSDITARKQSDDAVRASERLLRHVIDTDPNFIVLKDRDGRFTLANQAMADAYGTTVDGLLGKTDADFHPIPAEYASYREDEQKVFATGDELHIPEEPFTTPRGERRWLKTTKRLLAGEDSDRQCLLAVAVDITEQKVTADALAASNRLYQLLADHGRDVVMLASAHGAIEYVSPSCERACGYTPAEVAANGFWFLVDPDDRLVAEAGWEEAFAGRSGTIEWRCCQKNGSHFWMETLLTPVTHEGFVTRVVASSRDVSLRKSLEVQMRQAQKLEAIGLLAGGVAHDFNNLLTVVNGCGELMREVMSYEDPNRPLVEDIIQAGERGAALTRQLLAFGRQQMLRVEVFDINQVIPETAKLLARLLGEDVIFRLNLDPLAGTVKADVGQLEQLVINLAVNARDAMPQGGSLLIETARIEVESDQALPSPDASPGRYVRLTVTDTGTGMSPEVLARLFEPFFTTKPVGQGTGLGLATVYGIVRQSGGFITVQSEVGQGTTFAIHLPFSDEESEQPKSSLIKKSQLTGSEQILIVEDDEAVRTLTTNILKKQGYRVESAGNGFEALSICDGLPTPPDVVLTDVVMPEMSGRELAETLIARYPGLKVAFLSGYTADAVLRHGIESDRVAFLQKPYTSETLSRFVRELLDETT